MKNLERITKGFPEILESIINSKGVVLNIDENDVEHFLELTSEGRELTRFIKRIFEEELRKAEVGDDSGN